MSGEFTTIFRVPVAADFSVAEVTPGEEDAAGGGADRSPGVVSGEADTFAGETVDVGSLDFLLSVTTEFSVAEVIGEDENDVWLLRGKP